jgi:TPR repeat protein
MGVSKDEQETIKWYTLAADQGNELAKKKLQILKSK